VPDVRVWTSVDHSLLAIWLKAHSGREEAIREDRPANNPTANEHSDQRSESELLDL
jgi:hypothetical protein